MDVLAYLRLISNPRDAGAFDRIVNYPRRGIGDTTKGRLLAWAARAGSAAARSRGTRARDARTSAGGAQRARAASRS